MIILRAEMAQRKKEKEAISARRGSPSGMSYKVVAAEIGSVIPQSNFITSFIRQ
jgi:hypothetical protein